MSTLIVRLLDDQAGVVFWIDRGHGTGLAENLRQTFTVQAQQQARVFHLGQAGDGCGSRLGIGQAFAGLGVGNLHQAISLLGCILGELFGFGASVGHGFIGLLTGSEDGIEGIHRRARQARLHIDAGHCDAQSQACGSQLREALIDALHQIAAQPLTALGGAIVGTDQFGARHQNRVQVTRGRQGHGAAGHQPIQSRQHMVALQHKGVRFSDFVEHPHIQLHHTGIAGQQVAGAGQRITQRRGEAGHAVGLDRRVGTQQVLHPTFDHPVGGRQQHHLLERLRPRQQQPGILDTVEGAKVQHHGAVLRVDLAHIGKRPSQRRQHGHRVQRQEGQTPGLDPWAVRTGTLGHG